MIKDIVVHLDGSSGDELRIQHAEAIASLSQGHVTGLFTNVLPDYAALAPVDGGAAAAAVLADLDDEARRSGDRIEQHLAVRFSKLGVANEVRRIDGMPGELANRAASEARWSDLFIVGQPYREDDHSRWNMLFEAVLFEGGRGVFVVPPGRGPLDAIRRVLVAWRDTREAARALAEALPFIERATRTALVLVGSEPLDASPKEEPETDIAKHLDRHGTKVEVSILETGERTVSEVVLDQARRMPADLVVMGGYGHSRTREWILGGMTSDMLSMSELPILMAH